jgi:signal transduction histidine kinase/CheY-like chemotaxis protein
MSSAKSYRSSFAGFSASGLSSKRVSSKCHAYQIGEEKKSSGKEPERIKKQLHVWRVSFFGLLLIVTCVIGFFGWKEVARGERELAENQYVSITSRASELAGDILHRKSISARASSYIMTSFFPIGDSWPMVYLEQFPEVMTQVNEVFEGGRTAFCPFVEPSELSAFENFAYQKLAAQYTNTSGVTYAGRGVWKFDESFNIVLESSGVNSTLDEIIAPILHHSEGDINLLMYNMYASDEFGPGVDSMLDCAQKELESGNISRACRQMSPFLMYASTPGGLRDTPGAAIVEPIYPATSNEIVGVIATQVLWDQLLDKVFMVSVEGIDTVITNGGQTFTFGVKSGVPFLKGSGDLHDSDHDSEKVTTVITARDFAKSDKQYELHMYPTYAYYNTYRSNSPIIGVGLVLLTMATTALFFYVYDTYMRKEINHQQEAADGKRKFVRFISHEVRTPLNTVTMGLRLLTDELKILDIWESQGDNWALTESDSKDTVETDRLAHSVKDENPKTFEASGRTPRTPESDLLNAAMVNLTASSDISKVSTKSETLPAPSIANNTEPLTPESHRPSNVSITSSVGYEKLPERRRRIGECIQLTNEIFQNSLSAVSVLNDFLNFDKIENGTLSLDLTIVSMWELIQSTTHEFALQAKQAKIKLYLDMSQVLENGDSDNLDIEAGPFKKVYNPSSPLDIQRDLRALKVAGDIIRLTQVIRNLISNALKFTPEYGTVDVIVSWIDDSKKSIHDPCSPDVNIILGNQEEVEACSGGTLVFHVKDSGAGLTEDQVAKLGREGQQFNVNQLQSGNGSGLGLYIAKGIIEQHDGSLNVTSEGLGKGTTFTIRLPMYRFPPEAVNKRKSSSSNLFENKVSTFKFVPEAPLDGRKMLMTETKGEQLHILVVDDSAMNRKMLVRILTNKGHSVAQAKNGKEAIDMFVAAEANNSPYATILMDQEMPKMDGPTATKELRNRGCKTLIVGISGNVMPEDVKNFTKHGADVVLPKPLNIADLENLWQNFEFTERSGFAQPLKARRGSHFANSVMKALPMLALGTSSKDDASTNSFNFLGYSSRQKTPMSFPGSSDASERGQERSVERKTKPSSGKQYAEGRRENSMVKVISKSKNNMMERVSAIASGQPYSAFNRRVTPYLNDTSTKNDIDDRSRTSGL